MQKLTPSLRLSQMTRAQKIALYYKLLRQEQSRRDTNGSGVNFFTNHRPLEFITKDLRQAHQDSWRNWRTILKAAYGETLDADEFEFFRRVAQRDPPGQKVRELWLIVGRRGGKDSVASLIAMECARAAAMGDYELRPGERPIMACFATDNSQAEIVFRYIKGYFETVPEFAAWVEGKLPNTAKSPIALKNKVDIEVTTNNYRAPRGRAFLGAIFDEVAFWKAEGSATPDIETYGAVRPALMPGGMIVGISTAYRKKGLLYQKYQDHFGRPDPHVLVIQADTRSFNPRYEEMNPGEIDNALELDRQWAMAEYFSIFRDDLQDAFPREIVEQCMIPGRRELPPERGNVYQAFVDPSGGRSDAMTLAIGHSVGIDRGVLDCVREVMPPFSPESVTKEFCDVCKHYGVFQVTGDRYGGDFVAEEFRKNGVHYVVAENTKSEYYLEAIALFTSSRVELLDHARMFAQFCSLERRVMPMGREAIQKPRYSAADNSIDRGGGHDDVANVVSAVMVEVAGKPSAMAIWAKLGR